MLIQRANAVLRAAASPIDATSSELAQPASAVQGRTIVVGFLVCLVAGAQALFRPNSVPTAAEIVMFTLYALSCLALGPLLYVNVPQVIAASVAADLFLGVVLSLGSAALVGALTLELMAMVVLYRLPRRWSLPIALLACALFLGTQYRHFFLVASSPTASGDFWKLVIPFLLIPGIAVALRSRTLLVQRLRATQAQLEAEMRQTAELAAARERARIARDMHDVLAHSLVVLTIQAQAARQIVTEQPVHAAAMLDEMVTMLRQSVAESRRLVGLLRETGSADSGENPLGKQLLLLMDRFGERTGVHCSLTESGEAHTLGQARESALRFALQEALTNAYRHGQARHVWATLDWGGERVTLRVRDDGTEHAMEAPGEGGGLGLRGMRERATALGGTLRAGPNEGGGFLVCVTLPLAEADVDAAVRDA